MEYVADRLTQARETLNMLSTTLGNLTHTLHHERRFLSGNHCEKAHARVDDAYDALTTAIHAVNEIGAEEAGDVTAEYAMKLIYRLIDTDEKDPVVIRQTLAVIRETANRGLLGGDA